MIFIILLAIRSEKISHALLDVLEHEKNIEENKELMNLSGVIITPHIAFYSDDSMKKMYEESFSSINRYLNDEKLIHQIHGI